MGIILASASPRRKEILQKVNINFEIIVSDADENLNEQNPEKFVVEIAKRKAMAIDKKDKIIVAADTAVAIDNKILGKPKDEKDAFEMLSLLQGKKHSVYTGVCVRKNEEIITFCEKSDVFFKKLEDIEISNYIATKEPFGKAGAYAIQGFGALLIEKIEGDYENIVGLPVSRLYDVLKKDFKFEGMI